MADFVDVEGSESAWLAAEGMCEEDEEFQISQSWACALEEDLHLPPYVLPPTPWLHVDDAGAHSTAPFSPASSGLMTPAPAPFTPMIPTHAPSAPEQTPHAPSTRAPLTTLPITPLRSAPEATPPARAAPVLPVPVPSPAEPVDGAPPRDALRLLMASARNAWKPPVATPKAVARGPTAPPQNAFEVMMKASTPATAPVDTPRGRGGGRGKGRGEGLAASAGRRWGGGRAYLAPHKRVEGTRLVVDGFTAPPVESLLYFLTHFHSDHYTGLTSKWSVPLYCSTVTARLVTRQLGVSPHVLRILTLGHTTVLPSGDRVTPVDANHCPGAVILLFELQDGRCVLHTGDFRYLPSMAQHPALAGKKIDLLYLDTTYCNPQYAFPSQAAAVDEVVMHCKLLLPANRTLVLFGAYSIGKERVYLQVARELGVHIYVDRARWRTLECIGLDPMDIPWLTTQAGSTRFRVVPMGHLRLDRLKALLKVEGSRYDSLVAFRPSGWCLPRHGGRSGGIARAGAVRLHEVPYSEHSSFTELISCVRDLRARKIIPTVNTNSSGKADAMVQMLLQHSSRGAK